MMNRTILRVYDDDTGRTIPVEELLDQTEELRHQLRDHITSRHNNGEDRFYCPMCKGSVWPCLHEEGFFKHYAPADPKCDWYTGETRSLSEIDKERFGVVVEGPLHRRLKKLIYEQLSSDIRFSDVKGDCEVIVDPETKQRRKPDVQGMFYDRHCVFELQLSRTYLKEIVGRQEFYRKRGSFIIWIFHGFDDFKENATAKDIYYTNRANALELDHSAEQASAESGKLMLRAHWLGYDKDQNGEFVRDWHSRLIDLEDLVWDTSRFKPYLIDPEIHEFSLLRSDHQEWLGKFEVGWMDRHNQDGNWQRAASKKMWEAFKARLRHRDIPSLQEAYEAGFEKVLDLLFALKHGEQHYGGHTQHESINHTLQYRPGFTDAVVAAAKAFGRTAVLNAGKTPKLIQQNLSGGTSREACKQLRAFDTVIKFVFPECIPYYPDQLHTSSNPHAK